MGITLHATVQGGVQRLRVQGEMNIYAAREVKDALMRELFASREFEADLRDVGELDTAGLQLLVMLKREARAAGKDVRLVGHSPAVREVMDICQLAGWFGDPLLSSAFAPGPDVAACETSMNLEAARQIFIEEAHEQLEILEEVLLCLEKGEQGGNEGINAMFRAAHTIKGSAGVFGFDAVVAFTHVVESVLDRLRNRDLAIGGDLVTLLLSCGDHIRTRVDCAAAGQDVDADAAASGEDLLASLRAVLDANTPVPLAGQAVGPVCDRRVEYGGAGAVESDNWHISLRFGREVLRNGMDPLSCLRYLGTLGTLVQVTTLPDGLPRAADMDPEACYLGYEIDLKSTVDKQTLEAAFEFVRDDCRIRILPPKGKLEEYVQLIDELPEDCLRVGEILVGGGTLTRRELDEALAMQARGSGGEAEGSRRPLGQILVNEGVVRPHVVAAALEKQRRVEEMRAAGCKCVKVPTGKLDRIMALAGQLVIAAASASHMAGRSQDPGLIEQTSLLSHLVAEIRDSALQLRMVQIGEVFNRFPRVVRDVSRELGKDIRLIVEGPEAELDKSMVEMIGDPLVHLVRNAIDHGIEPAPVRERRGKPVRGTVRLSAHHDSGSIVIGVTDDGGGLNRAKILAKAIETGRVPNGAELADREVLELVMEPGFSTADTVTAVSGRGVGMDVVRRNVESMRGTFELDSVEGEGTAVRIRLPLTLAAIDSVPVQADLDARVVPGDAAFGCVERGRREEASSGQDSADQGPTIPGPGELHALFEAGRDAPARENPVMARCARSWRAAG